MWKFFACHPCSVHPCGEEHNFIPQFRLITEPSYLGQQIKIVRLVFLLFLSWQQSVVLQWPDDESVADNPTA